jgi:Rho-binding antiterminator
MPDQPAPYVPISCDFHDLLEVHATQRKPARISYRDDGGAVRVISAVIADLYARDGADYLSTDTGVV